MTCREFAEFLADYLSGDLAGPERTIFEAHLRECRDCSTYLESYEQAVRLGKASSREPDEPVPDDVPEELVRAILATRSRLQ